jgi:hypothetical protein
MIAMIVEWSDEKRSDEDVLDVVSVAMWMTDRWSVLEKNFGRCARSRGGAVFDGGEAQCDDAVAVTQQSSYPKPLLGDGASQVTDTEMCL